MDSTTFRYLLGMAVQHSFETQLLDVVTAYLYGLLDANLNIKSPPDYLPQPIPANTSKSFSSLKLQSALYGLKQTSRMWYSYLHSFFFDHKFQHDQSLPCIFTLRDSMGFVIVAVYIDDLNLVETPATCKHVVTLLTNCFKMKLLGKTSYCLGLQVAHLPDGSIFLHQTTYTQKVLKHFRMDKASPLSALMICQSKTKNDPYQPCEEEEEEEYDRTRYLAAVGAILYPSTFTRLDISFTVSVLARHNQRPSARHWSAVKHVLRYLRSTEDLGFQYTKGGQSKIVGYANVEYKSDVLIGKFQTVYIFLQNNAPILWKSVK